MMSIRRYLSKPQAQTITGDHQARGSQSDVLQSRSRWVTLVALFSVIYWISAGIPLSSFIGGAGFITCAIIALPVIAYILEPWQTAVSIFIGALLQFILGIGYVPVFGLPALLIPTIAGYLGSIAFHFDEPWFKARTPLWLALPFAYMLFEIGFYLSYSQGTPLFLLPFALAIPVIASMPLTKNSTVPRLVGASFITAMSEQVGLNVSSIGILHLIGSVWSVITPFMYAERSLATIGSLLILGALLRNKGFTSILANLRGTEN